MFQTYAPVYKPIFAESRGRRFAFPLNTPLLHWRDTLLNSLLFLLHMNKHVHLYVFSIEVPHSLGRGQRTSPAFQGVQGR